MGMKLAIALAALLTLGAALRRRSIGYGGVVADDGQLSNDPWRARHGDRRLSRARPSSSPRNSQAAGLKPAGDNGSWFQSVPMHEIRVRRRPSASATGFCVFLHDLTISPTRATPARVDAPLSLWRLLRGGSLRGGAATIVICHGTHKAGLPGAGDREAAVRAAGAVGMLTIADPGFTIEPPRWPYAYARTVTHADRQAEADPFLRMTLNAGSLGKLLAGSGRNAAALIAAGSAGKPLPSFAFATG